jgi:ADP-heptose:LPS heptosyltransferase
MTWSTAPSYRWPAHLTAWRRAPLRWLCAAAFVIGYTIGRVRALIRGPQKRILVIRTDGLGDAVLFEPAMRSLASRYPSHQLHLWAPAAICELFRATPYVAQLLEIPRGCKAGNLAAFTSPAWRARLGYGLGRWRFDLAIYPAESAEPLGNWLLTSTRSTERWLIDGDLENQFDWQRDEAQARATRVIPRCPDGGHELLRNAHVAAEWGAHVADELPRVYPSDMSSQIAHGRVRFWRSEVARLGASSLVGIVPAGTMATKTYPPASWAAALRELWQRHRAVPAMIGSPAEAATIQEILALTPDVPALTIGSSLDVLSLATLLGQLDAVISVDTGPAHFALAQKVPTVILCGGSHPGRFFPWPNVRSSVVLNHRMPCEGCHARCHLPEPECLTKITPDEIVGACLNVLGRSRLRIAV